MFRMNKTIAALLSASALTACTVGPDHIAPAIPPTASAPFVGVQTADVTADAPADDWWTLYDDPVLDALVEDALAANTDIRVALARIERARASLRGSWGEALPQTKVSASGSYGRVSESETLPGIDREGRRIAGEFAAGYELDLFGRVARGIEASRAAFDARGTD